MTATAGVNRAAVGFVAERRAERCGAWRVAVVVVWSGVKTGFSGWFELIGFLEDAVRGAREILEDAVRGARETNIDASGRS